MKFLNLNKTPKNCIIRAKYGDGQWNVTKAYAKVGDKYYQLDEGRVKIIEGI